MMPRDWIRGVTRFRYTLPVMALLHQLNGAKFLSLVRMLSASDRAIRQALDHLIDLDWVERNPGYGHPSRPEYILTSEGSRVAPDAAAIWSELSAWSNEEIAMERWPLVALDSVLGGNHRFAQISKDIGATPRAVALALQRLDAAGLVERKVIHAFPPTTLYEPTQWGICLLSPSGELRSPDGPSPLDSRDTA